MPFSPLLYRLRGTFVPDNTMIDQKRLPRVLHLFNVFGAATEKAMLDYTLALAREGFDLRAGYETLAGGAPEPPFPRVRLARIPVEPEANIPAQMERIAAAPRDPALLALLGERIDLVHGHFGPRILQGSAWLRRGVPMVVSIYGYDATRLLRDPSWIERYRWAAGRGATFVALARSMADRLVSLGLPKERVRLIRLGVALDEHDYDPRPAPAVPRFVFIGRLVEKKGAEVLIRAMKEMELTSRVGAAATLEIIGAGPLEQGLGALVEELGLGERIRFAGTVPFVELFARLHGATALVQPSVEAADGDCEGAPMVLMHAQAGGLPCVTTRHVGNPEVLPPIGQRFVVPERNPRALAAAMAAMAGLAPAARAALQAEGRAWIERHYNQEQTVREYAALYRELLTA